MSPGMSRAVPDLAEVLAARRRIGRPHWRTGDGPLDLRGRRLGGWLTVGCGTFCRSVYAVPNGFAAVKFDADLDGRIFFSCRE